MKKALRILAWIPTGAAYLIISPFALVCAVVVVPMITMIAIFRYAQEGEWRWKI